MSHKSKFKASNFIEVPNEFFDKKLKHLSLEEIKDYLKSLRSKDKEQNIEVEHE